MTYELAGSLIIMERVTTNNLDIGERTVKCMYEVVKRDGRVVEFDISRIITAMKKAFDASDKKYDDDMIDFLAIKDKESPFFTI